MAEFIKSLPVGFPLAIEQTVIMHTREDGVNECHSYFSPPPEDRKVHHSLLRNMAFSTKPCAALAHSPAKTCRSISTTVNAFSPVFKQSTSKVQNTCSRISTVQLFALSTQDLCEQVSTAFYCSTWRRRWKEWRATHTSWMNSFWSGSIGSTDRTLFSTFLQTYMPDCSAFSPLDKSRLQFSFGWQSDQPRICSPCRKKEANGRSITRCKSWDDRRDYNLDLNWWMCVDSRCIEWKNFSLLMSNINRSSNNA